LFIFRTNTEKGEVRKTIERATESGEGAKREKLDSARHQLFPFSSPQPRQNNGKIFTKEFSLVSKYLPVALRRSLLFDFMFPSRLGRS
jgi:hypothetical protein